MGIDMIIVFSVLGFVAFGIIIGWWWGSYDD